MDVNILSLIEITRRTVINEIVTMPCIHNRQSAVNSQSTMKLFLYLAISEDCWKKQLILRSGLCYKGPNFTSNDVPLAAICEKLCVVQN